MSILFAMPSSADQEINKLLTTPTSPAGYTCFEKDEIRALSTFIKQADVRELNYNSLKESYSDCMSRNKDSFFSSMPAITAYVVSALAVGFLAGQRR